jgi:23S rRNA (adenine2503-C2)-methyltransferase
MERIDLKELTPAAMVEFFAGLGNPAFRAHQIFRWIYKKGVSDFAAMTDLGKELRQTLIETALVSDWSPETRQVSQDSTVKYLFRLSDGESVETVRIPMESGRTTLCISSQAGCAMGCQFCMTGTFGLTRNLTVGEIVNQVCAASKEGKVDNIVLMGMGEPLHNLDNVVSALEILYASHGFDLGPRRVTLSTCGLVPEMRQLGQRIRVGLAVSLNATTDAVRDRLMPVNQRYPLKSLLRACQEFPLQGSERITFEYILISGVNDSLEDAKRLVGLLHGVKAKVNLIRFNEHACSEFKSPGDAQIKAFQSLLLDSGVVAVMRASKGQDISAACGQLKGLSL